MSGISEVGIVPDVELLFGGGNRCIDQRTGLSLFGPILPRGTEIPMRISLGVIGSKRTSDLLLNLIGRLARPIWSPPSKGFMPDFPGLSMDSPLGFSIECSTTDCQIITAKELKQLSEKKDFDGKVRFAYGCLEQKLQNFSEREPKPQIVVVALPPEFEEECTKYWDRFGRPIAKKRRKVRTDPHDEYEALEEVMTEEAEEIHFSSMWRVIKSKGMQLGIPTQVIRPSTLLGTNVQDMCTVAWNLAVAFCYKAGGHPWRLANASIGTCFVGISFYESKTNLDLKTSVAQVFSHRGEGLVLKGGKARKEESDRQPHLKRGSAKRLLEQVLDTYRRQEGHPPHKVVIHKSSKFSEEESDGVLSALDSVEQSDLVAVGGSGFRLLRAGDHPPIRGTYSVTTDNRLHLYTKGYVPFMGQYWGPSTPRPLSLLQHVGDSPNQALCEDILGLTKMNWNSAAYCLKEPITLSFSRTVGGLLSESETRTEPRTSYRFYM